MYLKICLYTLVIIALLSAAGLTACSGTKTSPSGQPAAPGAGQTTPRSAAPGLAPGGPLPADQSGPAKTPLATPIKMVTGDGTLAIITYANLYFGSAGQIKTISVKTGDRVLKGMILANLDISTLEANLAQAKVNLDQAQIAQAQAKVNLDQAQLTLVQSRIALDQAYVVQIQAEYTLTATQFSLDKVKAVSDIKDVMTNLQQHIAAAEVNKHEARAAGNDSEFKAINQYILEFEAELEKQGDKLAALLSTAEYSGANSLSYDVLGQTYDRLTVQDARMKKLAADAAQMAVAQAKYGIEMAQKNIEKANDGIVLAQMAVDKAGDGITLSRKNLDLIQEQLVQAAITAPFDGIIAVINQNPNDFVTAPAQSQRPIIYLVDPTAMQLNISVNELDIPQIKIGQKANIRIDAYPDVKFEGKVTNILLIPAVQSGIVDYTVTVSFNVPPAANVMIGMHASASIIIE